PCGFSGCPQGGTSPGPSGGRLYEGVKGCRLGLTGPSLSLPRAPYRLTGSSGVGPTLPYPALVTRESARLSSRVYPTGREGVLGPPTALGPSKGVGSRSDIVMSLRLPTPLLGSRPLYLAD